MDQGVLIRQLQGTAKEPLPFAAGWANYSIGFEGATCSRFGRLVVLQGLVSKPGGMPTLGDVIATLPTGFRPTGKLVFVTHAGEPGQVGRVDVESNGQVVWINGGPGETDYTTLSGIAFVVD